MRLTESVASLTLVQAAPRPERKKLAAHDVVARSRQVRARRGLGGLAWLAVCLAMLYGFKSALNSAG